MRCLLCGAPNPDRHHFPRTRKFGGATVPLCRTCHTKAHAGHHPTIERLIAAAPVYWQSVGEWEANKEGFETWLARREYIQCVAS
jgi:hypothetical protein